LELYPVDFVDDFEIDETLRAKGITRAYLFRNDYLAWCGAVLFDDAHEFCSMSFIEVSKRVKTHGGLSEGVRQGRKNVIGFFEKD
jgi:hypothetical protein